MRNPQAAMPTRHPYVLPFFISTNSNPEPAEPLISSADSRRHYELFQGRRDAHAGKWKWIPFTSHSDVDNLQPLLPNHHTHGTVVVWMRGSYRHNRGRWTTKVVGAKSPETHDN